MTMYCMNCGVKLADSETHCPLCGLRAYHPDLPRTPGQPLYPRDWSAPKAEKSGWRILLSISFGIALTACLMVDLLISGKISWSGFAIGGILTGYLVLVLPMWFRRPNWVVLLGVDFLSIGLLLLYIDLAVSGGWFLSFALPVTALYGALVTGTAALVKYVRKGWFFLFGGASIAFGCSAMLLEFFLSITFHTKMFLWSLYPMAALCANGLFWILAGILRPLGNAIRKRIFV